jgi:L-iditol 2-dehydrogenase
MLAAIKTENYQEIIVKEIELQALSTGEVLIKVDYCGVCGSDLHAYNNAPAYETTKNRILGHEIFGTVIDTFDHENTHLLNKSVIVESIQGCGKCSNCLEKKSHICNEFKVIGVHYDGGMAEFVKCQAKFVQEVPNDLPGVLGALIEPMAIAIHAVEYIAHISPGNRVLVQGPGIIGFFVGLACMNRGAKVILSGLPRDYEARLKHCSSFGMEPYIIGEAEKFIDKVDVIFECSGSNKALHQGLNFIKKGGKVVLVAMYEEEVNLFLSTLVRNEISLLSSYGCQSEEYKRALQIIKQFESKLMQIVSIYQLSEAPQAFNDAVSQKVLKPILQVSKN